MLGSKTLTDAAGALVGATLLNPAAFTAITAAGGALEVGFSVEEAEMLVDLKLALTYSNTVREATDFTLFVDGADLSAGTNGFYRHTAAVIADQNSIYFDVTLRLAQGFHTVAAQLKAPTGDVTVQGASIPCTLTARRHSHPATLGHGVDSKTQLIQ